MKLIKFTGKNIRGYMNIDVNFRDQVTFLIGINGSGKTTVLKLLSGLLTPSIEELIHIEFSKISVKFANVNSHNAETFVTCEKQDNIIKLFWRDKNIAVEQTIDITELKRLNSRVDNRGELFAPEHIVEFERGEVISRIKEIQQPLFLGLNRRSNTSRKRPHFEQRISYRSRHNMDEMFNASLDVLNNIQQMFHDSIRGNARSQSAISDDFRRKVFSESFKESTIHYTPQSSYKKELEKLHRRRKELNSAIEKLAVKDLETQFEVFFNSIQTTLEKLNEMPDNNKNDNKYYNYLLKWMIEQSQIEKIDKIIQHANTYSSSITRLKAPILRFTNSVNLFLKESRKEISVDEQGEIKIKVKGSQKVNSIFELSSGEQQLIIMLAYLSFWKENRYAPIFIIDEPELSLHISWQEIFVEALIKASPDMQFVLATHSPAILSNNDSRNFCEDLSNKY